MVLCCVYYGVRVGIDVGRTPEGDANANLGQIERREDAKQRHRNVSLLAFVCGYKNSSSLETWVAVARETKLYIRKNTLSSSGTILHLLFNYTRMDYQWRNK